jgi:hypothetical protein
MKQIKRFTKASILLFLLVATACKKGTVQPTPPPVNAPVDNRISRIEFDDDYADAAFNADGTIKTIVNKKHDGTVLHSYAFSYEDGKLKEVNFGGKWRYTYASNLLVKVETINDLGEVRYQTDLFYINSRLAVKTESIVRTGLGVKAYMKTEFSYNAAGNISKKVLFQFINNDWSKSEEINIPEYDRHVNTSDSYENYPYLPIEMYSKNNPLREIYTDNYGTVTETITHEYKYDASGRVTERNTKHNYPGFPETVEQTKIYY